MTSRPHRPDLGALLKHTFFAASVAALLVACGGGGGTTADASTRGDNATTSTPNAKATPSVLPTSTSPPSAQTIAQQKEGARLNSEELAQIAQTGVLPQAFEGPLLSGAEKAASSGGAKIAAASPRTAAYRFFNTKTSAHFFTTSTAERDNVQSTLPFMSFEGPAFYAAGKAVPGLSPVHRFYNTQTGVHFYTISESERALVAASLPQFAYEGIAYYASTLPGTGYTPLYRFFYSAKGFHFYTNSQSERDNIIATLPQYSYEGVGYYVLDTDWKVPAIPHSGVTSSQCYRAGSDTLVPCASAGALALNPQQDGHRAAINPMSYGGVPGHKPLDSCVQDQVTGLIWEVKTASGVRNGANTYSNAGSGLATDSSGYVAAINAAQLCGFSDWRMPTVQELQGIVDYSATGAGPMIKTAFFPNTQTDLYWASDTVFKFPNYKWTVVFDPAALAVVTSALDTTLNAVRLVRGAVWTGPRYLFETKSYPGDGTNNVVIDRQTGLTWRRCEEGRKWDGEKCTGFANPITHEATMVMVGTMQNVWRLPNMKELTSSVDGGFANQVFSPTAFPGAITYTSLWSSTPHTPNTSQAEYVETDSGSGGYHLRTSESSARLVSTSP